MKINQFFTAAVSTLLLLAGLIAAQAQSGQAEVQGILGVATYSVGGGAALPLRKGVAIPAGALVKTGRGSALDLYFGPEVGTIRLTGSDEKYRPGFLRTSRRSQGSAPGERDRCRRQTGTRIGVVRRIALQVPLAYVAGVD